ncbi:MAG: hypothetical protein LUD18_05910, partial [Lachnospiraceae bacterium]|nr:hypothetical protein [Lachnospiraceae bacterium]
HTANRRARRAARRPKSITRSTVVRAYDRICEMPEEITGPKKLNAFGAPYIWAIFRQLKLFPLQMSPGRKDGKNR